MDITKSFISDTKIDSVDRISLPFRARTLNELNDWKLALYREKQIIIVSKKVASERQILLPSKRNVSFGRKGVIFDLFEATEKQKSNRQVGRPSATYSTVSYGIQTVHLKTEMSNLDSFFSP